MSDNSAQTSFKLAVALSDANDRDNDTPDIRDVEEFPYTEPTEESPDSQEVASFDGRLFLCPRRRRSHRAASIRRAGCRFLRLKQEGTNVKNRLKVVEVGRDEDSVHYEIHTKSAEELFVKDAEGTYKLDPMTEMKIPIEPLDHEGGDEVEVDITW